MGGKVMSEQSKVGEVRTEIICSGPSFVFFSGPESSRVAAVVAADSDRDVWETSLAWMAVP